MNESEGPNPTLRFRCPRKWIEQLEAIAKDQRRDLSDLCRIIIEDYLNAQRKQKPSVFDLDFMANKMPPKPVEDTIEATAGGPEVSTQKKRQKRDKKRVAP